MLAQRLGLSLPTLKNVSPGGFDNLYSLDFDGVDDYVTMGDQLVFTPNSSGADRGFSVSCWIKTSSNRKGIISKIASGQYEWIIEIDRFDNPKFRLFSSGDVTIYQSLTATTDVVDGNWHHIVGTFDLADATTSLIIYVDGTPYSGALGNATYSSAGTWVSVSNTTSPLQVGDMFNVGAFPGNIDEVSLFDDVLSAAQVTSFYNSGTPTDLSGESYLLGYWRNGDTAGTSVYPTIEDYSSNSNDGTMTNMASGDIVTVVP
jgi:hypothetical protein